MLGNDNQDLEITQFFLLLASLPLLYIIPLALISSSIQYFYPAPPTYENLGNEDPTRPLFNTAEQTYGTGENQLHQIPFSDHSWSYFARSAPTYSLLSKIQIALALISLAVTIAFTPLGQGDKDGLHLVSDTLIQYFLIVTAYWSGYSAFLSTFHASRFLTQFFLFFNFMAWSVPGLTYFCGFLFVNGLKSDFVWAEYFGIYLVQCFLTSLIGIKDIYNIFKWTCASR